MSRDGHLVLTHDDTLSRVTNVARLASFAGRKPWRVADFTLEELRSLDFGSFFVDMDPFEQVAAGLFSDHEIGGFRKMILPTLEEGLRYTREHNFRINVEIKDLHGTPGHGVVVEKVLDMIRHLDLVDQTLISSFNFDYLHQVQSIMPNMPVAALMEAANMGKRDIFQTLMSLGVQAWHPDREILRSDDLRKALGEGLYVNVWTVNDPREMRSLVVQGVTGLITDFPQMVRAAAD
jgi:glycerophosphoryl diester phosphodiesterase